MCTFDTRPKAASFTVASACRTFRYTTPSEVEVVPWKRANEGEGSGSASTIMLAAVSVQWELSSISYTNTPGWCAQTTIQHKTCHMHHVTHDTNTRMHKRSQHHRRRYTSLSH